MLDKLPTSIASEFHWFNCLPSCHAVARSRQATTHLVFDRWSDSVALPQQVFLAHLVTTVPGLPKSFVHLLNWAFLYVSHGSQKPFQWMLSPLFWLHMWASAYVTFP
jgi:hypothetical protein